MTFYRERFGIHNGSVILKNPEFERGPVERQSRLVRLDQTKSHEHLLPSPNVPPTTRAIRRCLLALAAERGAVKTFCPSEAARRLAPDDWRCWMPQIRAEARRLVQSGHLRCTQRGREVDPLQARGPLRFSQP